jgi:PadR family transcriptional regulator, regulatory protein PadR
VKILEEKRQQKPLLSYLQAGSLHNKELCAIIMKVKPKEIFMEKINSENTQAQMRKGILDFIVLVVVSRQPIYVSDILRELKTHKLIIVEGTLYPLLSRLKNAELLKYSWKESKSGPPRKYYSLTKKGEEMLRQLSETWEDLSQSINSLKKSNK